MNENVLLGCFCIFWRGLRHDFDLFCTKTVIYHLHLGAFDGFRSARVLGWPVMFGWLTVFVHGVFHCRLWGARLHASLHWGGLVACAVLVGRSVSGQRLPGGCMHGLF